MEEKKQTRKRAKTKVKLSELIPDNENFNKGNEFGGSLINKSIRQFGFGRSILIDKNNKIIAGNKSVENAAEAGFEDVIIVEATGNEVIAVKRNDVDLDTPEGREMALADNATAVANITWDEDLLKDNWQEEQLRQWGVHLNYDDITPDNFQDQFESATDENAVYPLVPKFDEDQEAFIILCDSEVDANWLRETLNMNKMQSYKRAELSKSNIVSFKDIKDAITKDSDPESQEA